ncbi:hypothetical protein [Pseudogracilibacillus auburnensis]|uniref:hypothetical protein n=1 Tax=Pseudogracilibacillus auburnensis TaxID=1494959 RepID=UPI001A95AC93|nr:hypothetical protein [Pseudogracilibacillus auburnensis]MBO1003939.1 hypothetical protein [Pseudogracilibacillus auburnensis]
MSILNELSSATGTNNQEPNIIAANKCITNPDLLEQIADGFTMKDQKLVGDCIEVFTKVSESQPELLEPYMKYVLPLLDSKVTRIRWEAVHTIALLAEINPHIIYEIEQKLINIIESDKSIIVRDYAITAFANLAKSNQENATFAFPILKHALQVWDGRHRRPALDGLKEVAKQVPEFKEELLGIAESYLEDPKGVVKKSAKALIRATELS